MTSEMWRLVDALLPLSLILRRGKQIQDAQTSTKERSPDKGQQYTGSVVVLSLQMRELRQSAEAAFRRQESG